MFTQFDTSPVVTHDPLTTPLTDVGYGPCLWCAGPAGFLAHEGPFCRDTHLSLHRQSETTWRRNAEAVSP